MIIAPARPFMAIISARASNTRAINLGTNLTPSFTAHKSITIHATQYKQRSSLHAIRASNEPSVSFTADDLASDANHNKIKSILYKVLTIALAGSGGLLLVNPTKAIEFAYAASPTPVVIGLTRLLGAVHILAALFANRLSDAAAKAHLTSDTYKRLNGGLFGWGAFSLLVFFTEKVTATPEAKILYATLLGAAMVFPIVLGKGMFAAYPPSPRLWPISQERLYSLGAFTAIIFGYSVAYSYFYPGVLAVSWLTTPIGALGTTILRLLGCAAALVSESLVTLQDGARRGRLGYGTFKQLNWGIALLGGTIVAMAQAGTQISVALGKGKATTTLVKLWPALPTTTSELAARWIDVYSEFAIGVSAILAAIALYNAIFAKRN